MVRKCGVLMCVAVGAFLSGLLVNSGETAEAQEMTRVFELRTYTTLDGELGALLERFSGGETDLFAKHGMRGVGYWVPADAPASENTLVYILSHESRDAAAASWQAFGSDPDWRAMRAASGRLVSNVESLFLNPTDFSPAH